MIQASTIGFRKKVDSDIASGVRKHAAGILFLAPDGDVLLLRRASGEQNFGGHWSLPGGKMEPGEDPVDGAEREALEEIGSVPGSTGMKALDLKVTPNGFAFYTFVRPVREKFTPVLNDEHSGFAWAPLDMLPKPIHPAVEQTIHEQIGDDGKDASAVLKWANDDAEEIKNQDFKVRVATDSSMALALDRESVREPDRDGRLRVKVSHISKATVNPYWGREIPDAERLGLDPNTKYFLLRDPEELAKAAPSFNDVQILRKHVPVNADDHQPDEVVGTTGTNAVFNDPYLDNSLMIWARDAIDRIESGEQCELSCGYHYRADMTPGVFKGQSYDGVMREIVGNHVALVKDGRAGPDVVVGDEAIKDDHNPMWAIIERELLGFALGD